MSVSHSIELWLTPEAYAGIIEGAQNDDENAGHLMDWLGEHKVSPEQTHMTFSLSELGEDDADEIVSSLRGYFQGREEQFFALVQNSEGESFTAGRCFGPLAPFLKRYISFPANISLPVVTGPDKNPFSALFEVCEEFYGKEEALNLFDAASAGIRESADSTAGMDFRP